jgi:hypothetical protein
MSAFALDAFGLRLRLVFIGRPAGPRRPRPAVVDLDPTAPAAPPDDRPLGCGWFDSSLDLAQGLAVREHASVQAVAGELPLADWLHFHAQGWRGAPLR